ncbi:MAG TPA: electron transport complex subunit RsxC [Feifaniaceae bacterium]|nr:electron transport complex subunit RsxC [Feifaniaceae bacterium]
MRAHPFSGGVHPLRASSHGKTLSSESAVAVMPAPDIVVIPMARVTGAPCTPVVKKGDSVKLGQCIGRSESFVSAPIHASVSGTVTAVENRPHPTGKNLVLSVVIRNDHLDTRDESYAPPENTDAPSGPELISIIREKGVVGLGGATFPTHVKLSIPNDKKVDVLIANGAECEPYLTADDRLLQEYSAGVIAGMQFAMRALNVKRAYAGIETNKPRAIRAMREAAKGTPIEIVPLRVKYPQGGEKQLIYTVTGREVPSGGLPSDAGCVVLNVGTCSAIYEAVALGKPLIERVVTVTGGGVNAPGNLLVRIGASFKDCIDFCGGMAEGTEKILSGGPMMGIAQYTDQVPVIAGTSGILVLSGKEAHVPPPSPCIHCGRCYRVCPAGLQPYIISAAVDRSDFAQAALFHALDCVECGACAFICPAHRQLLQSMRLAKLKVRGTPAKN